MAETTIYLGDGAYARSDGHEIIVYADRDAVTRHWVSLEPNEVLNLLRFADRMWGPGWRPADTRTGDEP